MARTTGALVLAVPILSLCAFYNGAPLLYADSIDYLIHGGDAFRMLVHDEPVTWVNTRSFFYALAILPLHAGVSAWPIVAAQALATAWLLWLVLRATLMRASAARFLAIVALLTLVTPAAWFTGYVMPDVFAALLVLAVFLVAFTWDDLHRLERIGIALLLWFAVVAHASHLLLGGVLAVAVAAIGLAQERALRGALRPAGRVAAVVVAGALSALLLHRALLGEASLTGRHPLFLLARTLADGPTRTYLRAHCPELDFAICEFSDRLPDNVRDVLWGEGSIWATSDEATRERLRAEEMRVVLAAVLADPWGQLRVSARNATSQLTHFGMAGSYFPDAYILARIRDALPRSADLWLRSRQARGDLHEPFFSMLHYATFGLSLLVVAALAPRLGRARTRRLGSLAAVVATALVANAAITGALSNVEDRYQARVVWLVPLVACLATGAWLDDRRASAPRAGCMLRARRPPMQARTLLLVGGLIAIAIAALAGYGLLRSAERRGSAVEAAGTAANSTGRGDTAAPQPATPTRTPRRGAGTVGARAGSLGAVAAPGGRTSSGSSAPAATGSTDVGESGPGVENVPPPTPGRDPRELERTDATEAPPDPTAFASSGGAPSAPANRAATAAAQPARGTTGGEESGEHPDQTGSNEAVPSEGALTEDEIARRADANLPEGRVMPLWGIEADRIRTNSNQAADFSR
jgi:hypothetical protein